MSASASPKRPVDEDAVEPEKKLQVVDLVSDSSDDEAKVPALDDDSEAYDSDDDSEIDSDDEEEADDEEDSDYDPEADSDVEALQAERDELKVEVRALKAEVKELKRELAKKCKVVSC
jgi:predicted RNase H-like nuclease (RuvC/YqgF family)